jgi:hypothetical protein
MPLPQYSISTAFLQRESFSFISSQRELTSFAFFEMGPRSIGLDVPVPPNFTSNNMKGNIYDNEEKPDNEDKPGSAFTQM